MSDRRLIFGLCAFGLACVGLVAGLSGYRAAPAAGQQRVAKATVVTVTAGKPSEFAFTLSKSSALSWQAASSSSIVTFKVTNRGALAHQFKICTTPVTSAKLNTCTGKATKLLQPGQSATLTITCKQRGTYEYLSSVPGQAAKGMKGLIGMGVNLAAPTTTTTPAVTSKPAAPTPSTPAPTPAPSSTPLTGAAAAGAALFESGCASCHALEQVRAAGTIGPSLNSTHSGGPFTNGPLTAQQLSDLAAYINT